MSDRQSFLERPVNEELARRLERGVWIVTALVFILVALMRSPYKIGGGEWSLSFLPQVNAALNTLVAACLLAALLCVKRQAFRWHQRWMTSALVLSALFLLTYVAYHFTTHEVLYGDLDGNGRLEESEKETIGPRRTVYLSILFSHIIAAAVSFPLILFTFVRAWTHDFARHRRLARKVFPLWLFVAVTGPVCYWMLKPYY